MVKNFIKFLIVLGGIALITIILAIVGIINPFNYPPVSWLAHLNQIWTQKVQENGNWYWISGSSNTVVGPTINNITPERVIEKTIVIREAAPAPVAPPPAPAPAQPVPERPQASAAESEQIQYCEEVTMFQPRGALVDVNIGGFGGGYYQPYYTPPVIVERSYYYRGSCGVRPLLHNVCTSYNRNWANPSLSQGGNGNRGTTVPCGNQGGGSGSHRR
jgi:hypothetical protein